MLSRSADTQAVRVAPDDRVPKEPPVGAAAFSFFRSDQQIALLTARPDDEPVQRETVGQDVQLDRARIILQDDGLERR